MKVIGILFIFISILSHSQSNRVPSYFGVQYQSVIPNNILGGKSMSFSNESFNSSISQKIGYSMGATVRFGITELIAFETGINFTKRNFNINMELPDSNLYVSDNASFIEYNIPLNCLIYIKMTKEWYANASLGIAAIYKPSSIGKQINPEGLHSFIYDGYVDFRKKISADFNANVGFEYRTKKSGFFYLGGSIRVPFSPLFIILTKYQNQGYDLTTIDELNGSYLSIDLKYFFPITRSSGSTFKPGPIE